MGFKKIVTLCCDGPCGTVLDRTEKAPVGWVKLTIVTYERLENGEKPKFKPSAAWLCPGCSLATTEILKRAHIALQQGMSDKEESAGG